MPDSYLDSYVDMALVQRYFSIDGWKQVDSLMKNKRKKPDYTCDLCFNTIDFDIINIVCDSCLNIYHLPCVGLKGMPKAKHWFCKACK